MPDPVPPPDSIRKKCLQRLVTNFEAITAGAPEERPYPFTFDLVTRLPVGNLATGKRAVVGIYPTENPKMSRAGIMTDCSMAVTIEVYIHKDVGEELPDLLEDAMASLERKLMEDQTLNGHALDVQIDRLDTDIDGAFDNQASGVISLTVRYRHHRDDPALAVGE